MAIYTVRRASVYRATISLGWFQSVASNETVADKFREAGFAEVTVWGTGRQRTGTALWPKEDANAQIPDEITDIQIEV